MMRRTRSIAGPLTCFVLALSLAEGVRASTCTPAMEMGVAPTAAGAMAHGAGGAPGRHDRQDRSGTPDCPFGPAGAAQGCASLASLPAASSVGLAPSPEGAELVTASETEPHLLLGSALFHPPKA